MAALAKSPEARPESVEAVQAALTGAADVPGWSTAEAAAWWKSRGARSGRPGRERRSLLRRGFRPSDEPGGLDSLSVFRFRWMWVTISVADA